MHIKEIQLHGFKSYRNETIVQNFSKGLNIIVGRNGSGKSNLFNAIQMILTDDFNKLRHADRLALRSEGRNLNDPAYVELAFDNSDRKLPYETDTVIFRRTIACKKDLFTVNGNEVPKANNILRSAGILNPFYFIKQGRINETATSSDADRLRLIKDIFGVAIFESTKVLSMRKIGKAREELDQAVKVLETYKKRNVELRQEVQDVEKYDHLDKQKRAIEILLRGKDVEKKLAEIKKLERERVTVLESLRPVNAKLTEILHKKEVLKGCLAKAERTILDKEVRKSEFSVELEDLVRQETAVFNEIAELESQSLAAQEEETKATEMAAANEARINGIKLEINSLEPQLEDLYAAAGTAGEAYTKAITRFEILQKLLGSSKRERREILLNVPQLEELHQLSVKTAEKRDKILQDQETVEEEREKAEADAASIRNHLDAFKYKRATGEQNLIVSTRALAAATRRRNEVYNASTVSHQHVSRFQERLQKEMLSIQASGGRAAIQAWEGVNKVLGMLEQMDTPETKEILEGYYGILLENVDCPPEYVTAVEVTAASKMFYHVVKNIRVGRAILEHFNSMGFHGTVSFLPVEDLQTRSYDFPEALLSKMVPLLGKVKCPPRVQPAVSRVFSGVLVCKSLEAGMKARKDHDFNYVTLDGDKAFRNGLMEGGYINPNNSVMKAQKVRKEMLREIRQYKESMAIHEVMGVQFDKEMKEHGDAKELNESELLFFKFSIDKLTSDLGLELKKVRNKKQREKQLMKDLEESTQLFNEYDNTYNETVKLVDEMKANPNFLAEENLIGQLKVQKKAAIDLAKKNKEKKLKHLASERKMKKLLTELEKLSSPAEEDPLNGSLLRPNVLKSNLEQFKEEVTRLVSKIRSHKGQILGFEDKIEQHSKKLAEEKVELERLEQKKKTVEERIGSIKMKLTQIEVEKLSLSESAKAMDSKTASCYPALMQEFKDLNHRQLSEKLKHISETLSGFPQINRKAKDQLALFEREVVNLEASVAYKKKSQKEIVDMFNQLDLEKISMALTKTRELQVGFREIFAELVNGGVGELTLYGDDPDTHFTESTPVYNSEAIRMWQQNEYVGLSVKVSFGTSQPLSDMKALSGGQKSIVALSLILAFQKSDPTSLYLFDEVDQALDPQNREAVAKKIKELSGTAQFICTTFRKEFIEHADKIFGVSFANRSSHVQEQSPEDAMSFVQNESPTESDEMDVTGSSLES